jgi:hypothetical protein
MTGQDNLRSDAAIDAEFVDLMCADEDLLRAEFDAIIAAEYPDPPPSSPSDLCRRAGARYVRPARRPAPHNLPLPRQVPATECVTRQRSPPLADREPGRAHAQQRLPQAPAEKYPVTRTRNACSASQAGLEVHAPAERCRDLSVDNFASATVRSGLLPRRPRARAEQRNRRPRPRVTGGLRFWAGGRGSLGSHFTPTLWAGSRCRLCRRAVIRSPGCCVPNKHASQMR